MIKEIKILLVEDNEGDIILTQEALKESKFRNSITVARNGEKAISYLASTEVLPDIILLDINLPKVDGIEVLSTIKNDPRLKIIPVIMLTTSSSERDILACYSNHANCFISKPVDLAHFIEVVNIIENFWISTVRLPQQNQHEPVYKY